MFVLILSIRKKCDFPKKLYLKSLNYVLQLQKITMKIPIHALDRVLSEMPSRRPFRGNLEMNLKYIPGL